MWLYLGTGRTKSACDRDQTRNPQKYANRLTKLCYFTTKLRPLGRDLNLAKKNTLPILSRTKTIVLLAIELYYFIEKII